MKKAVVEVQFHWIFILIVGAIILLFFTTIILKQKAVSEERLSVDVLNSMDSILTGAIISPQTLHSIDAPNVDIEFTCEDYSIGRFSKTLGKYVVFSPDLLRGREIMPWALPWDTPYRVTNFLFLTTDNLKYVVVDNPSETLDNVIYEELKVTKQLVSNMDAVKPTNNYKIKFIFFDGGDLNTFTVPDLGILDKDITAINIKPNPSAQKFGEIDFYKKQGAYFADKKTSYYLTNASLYGAIFAQDKEAYECVMEKALERLNLVTRLQKARAQELTGYVSNPCPALYNSAAGTMDNLLLYSGEFTEQSIGGLYANSQDLIRLNLAAQLKSCPLIY